MHNDFTITLLEIDDYAKDGGEKHFTKRITNL